ncbi:MAG: hypothetical protein ACFFD1_01795 [Candidatus Thorarchaeota archaeon]
MGLFGSNKPYTCWICQRKTDEEGAFLHPDDLKNAFQNIFKDFNVNDEFNKICCCEVCAGIMKLCSSDSLAAKMKLSSAASAAGSAANQAAARVKNIISRKKE